MWKHLGLVSLLVLVACKGKDEGGASPAGGAAAADSVATQAAASFAEAAAALAKAQAAASAAARNGAAASALPAVSAATAPSASAAADAGFSASVANELGRLGFSTAASSLVALGKIAVSCSVGSGVWRAIRPRFRPSSTTTRS